MDHFAVFEAHDPPAMVPMMKITSDSQKGQGQKGVPRNYFVVENSGKKPSYVKIGWKNHYLSKSMVQGLFCSG